MFDLKHLLSVQISMFMAWEVIIQTNQCLWRHMSNSSSILSLYSHKHMGSLQRTHNQYKVSTKNKQRPRQVSLFMRCFELREEIVQWRLKRDTIEVWDETFLCDVWFQCDLNEPPEWDQSAAWRRKFPTLCRLQWGLSQPCFTCRRCCKRQTTADTVFMVAQAAS